MSLPFVVEDADTGNEIIVFERRKRIYAYLRDAVTKAFIKRLERVRITGAIVFDYPREEARKSNPLYVDISGTSAVEPDKLVELREEKFEHLIRALADVLFEKFGMYVVNLAEVGGIEYGSRYEDITEYPEMEVIVIWHHYGAVRNEVREVVYVE